MHLSENPASHPPTTPARAPPRSQKGGGCPGERAPQPGEPSPAQTSPARRVPARTAPAGSLTLSLRARSGAAAGERGVRCPSWACEGLVLPCTPRVGAGAESLCMCRALLPPPRVIPQIASEKNRDNEQASEQINDNNNNRSPIS